MMVYKVYILLRMIAAISWGLDMMVYKVYIYPARYDSSNILGARYDGFQKFYPSVISTSAISFSV